MKKRLDHLIDVLSLSSDEHSIRLALLTFAQQCGFEKFAYVNLRYGDTEAFSNYPQEWQEIYLANDYQRIDPVVTAARRALKPFYWSAPPQRPEPMSEEREFYRHASRYGIVSGLSIPIRIGFGRTAILTLASHLPAFKGEGIIDDIQAITATTLVHAKLKGRSVMARPRVQLSGREKECLNWAALGKTIPVTADILGINHHTVRYYLGKARRKLRAHNTVNAVYLAARHGLI